MIIKFYKKLLEISELDWGNDFKKILIMDVGNSCTGKLSFNKNSKFIPIIFGIFFKVWIKFGYWIRGKFQKKLGSEIKKNLN